MGNDVPRLKSLDSLRGIAALAVVLHHCVQYTPDLERNPFLHRLFPGGGAVLIFFVLSGLVLSMTYVYRDGDRVLSFLIKRIFRIWPPFAVAIAIAAISRYALGYHVIPGTTTTFASNWAGPFSAEAVASHLLMTGSDMSLNYPMWSLVLEMRISIIFPFIVALVIWNWPVALAASIAACLLVAGPDHASTLMDILAPTVRFIPLFVIGSILALKVRELRHLIGSASGPVRAMLWIICLLGVAMSADYSHNGLSFVGSLRLIGHGVAAAGIVMLCATGGRIEHWLTARMPHFLGQISYSLYLIHVVVITAVVRAFYELLPVPILVITSAAVSVGIATVMERYIERPSAQWGRQIAGRLFPRPAARAEHTGA